MDPRTRNALLALSIPSDLIQKIDFLGHTLTMLRAMPESGLRTLYDEAQAQLLSSRIRRQPIPDDVVDAALAQSGGVCTYCADGNATRPYQIHHIDPYATTQDNSIDNLLVVCPTHHATIHARSDSAIEQKRQRAIAHATVKLAKAYSLRGLSFSYGMCEVIVFVRAESAAVELVRSMGPLSPFAARELSSHDAAASVLSQLSRTNFALVSGGSGSGKSTLAIGVAGNAALGGAIAIRYRRSATSDNRVAMREILELLESVVEPCVLILDDVNLWLTDADVETLCVSATPFAKIIATVTSEQNTARLETHLHDRLNSLTWQDLRFSLVEFLTKHEAEVAPVLRSVRPPDWIEKIGLDPLSTSVGKLAQRYAETAQNVWQFIFLLRGGWSMVAQDLRALVGDRSDVPLLYAAIEQIADIERGVTAHEVARGLAGTSGDGSADATPEWIQSVFERLCARRIMVRTRDSFTTAHRDWARAYISASLDDERTAPIATRLLLRDFNVETAHPRRLMILWSWFFYDTAGAGRFARDWAKERSIGEWQVLVGTAAAKGIVELGWVADRLGREFSGRGSRVDIGQAFAAHEESIVARLVEASQRDWYWVRELFTFLNGTSPELARRILHRWPTQVVGRLVNETMPIGFDNIVWFLSGIEKHSPDWAHQVGLEVDWNQVSENLSKVEPGRADDVLQCADVLRRLGIPETRFQLRRFVDAMRDSLAVGKLAEIDFDLDIFLPLELLPQEARRITDGLDHVSLARELVVGSPRLWGQVLSLARSSARAGGDFAERLIDQVDIAALTKAMERNGEHHPRGVRMLLWLLAIGKRDRGPLLAEEVFAAVHVVAERCADERGDLAKALAALDRESGQSLASMFGVDVEPVDLEDAVFRRTIFEALPEGEPLLARVAELEGTGEDYDISALLEPYLKK